MKGVFSSHPSSEIRSLKSPVQEHMDGFLRGKHPLMGQQQSSAHSMSFSDQEERNNLLPNGRSISLVDLQDSHVLHSSQGPLAHHEAPPQLSRVGSQASIGHPQSQNHHNHLSYSNPHTPQPPLHLAKPSLRDSLPQSAPQVRRPLHPSLSQQRSLQPLSFQNPVYHLSNLTQAHTHSAHSLQHDSSSENLSTESSHNSHSNSEEFGGGGSQAGVKGCVPSNSSLEEFASSRRSMQSEECLTPRRHTLPEHHHHHGTATAVAIPRQSTTAGTAHIVRVEQQSRGGAGSAGARTPRSLPHSASLRSSSSVNTEPVATVGQAGGRSHQQSTCSMESPVPPVRSIAKQAAQQVMAFRTIFKHTHTHITLLYFTRHCYGL